MSTRDFLEKDYYKTLGVPKDAKPDEIKKSYRKLARKYHPDANADGTDRAKAEERFKEISEAYDVLVRPRPGARSTTRRARCSAPAAPAGSARPAARAPRAAGRRSTSVTCSAAPPVAAVSVTSSAGCSASAEPAGPGRAPARRRRRVVGDAAVRRSRSRASPCRCGWPASSPARPATAPAAGTARCRTPARSARAPGRPPATPAGFAFAEPCRECRGRGLVVDDPCPDCSGTGRAMGTRTLTVRIPAGVKDGPAHPAQGQGRAGRARRPQRRPLRHRRRRTAPPVRAHRATTSP